MYKIFKIFILSSIFIIFINTLSGCDSEKSSSEFTIISDNDIPLTTSVNITNSELIPTNDANTTESTPSINILEIPKSTTEMSLFSDDRLGYSFEYPSAWRIETSQPDDFLAYPGGSATRMWFKVKNDQRTAKEYWNWYLSIWNAPHTKKEVILEGERKIDNYISGYQATFLYTLSDGTARKFKLLFVSTTTNNIGSIYILAYDAYEKDFNDHVPIFDTILNSFQITSDVDLSSTISNIEDKSPTRTNIIACIEGKSEYDEIWFYWNTLGTSRTQLELELRGTESERMSTVAIHSYLWDFGDGETAQGEYTKHTYQSGNWSTILTVYDVEGNCTSQLLMVNVTGGKETNDGINEASATSPDLVAYMQFYVKREKVWAHWQDMGTDLSEWELEFRGTESQKQSAVEIQSYYWDFGDGETAEGEFVKHTYYSGSWSITLTVCDAEGNCASETQNIEIRGTEEDITPIEEKLVAFIQFWAPQQTWIHWGIPIWTDRSEWELEFRGTESQKQSTVAIQSYKWDFGDGKIAWGEYVKHTYYSGNWSITLTVCDSKGNCASETLKIEVRG